MDLPGPSGTSRFGPYEVSRSAASALVSPLNPPAVTSRSGSVGDG